MVDDTGAGKIIEQLRAEIIASAEATGCIIRCCEGGGDENICATLAVSIGKLKDENEQLRKEVQLLRDIRDSLIDDMPRLRSARTALSEASKAIAGLVGLAIEAQTIDKKAK